MADETISFDLNCTGCDYNARGLAASATCPECGRRVLDSIAEHLRRRTPLRVEHARFAERPRDALHAIRDAGTYAVVANGIAALWLLVRPWMLQRHSPGRALLLVLLCIAMACAAMSIWRLAVPPQRPSRWGQLGRWLLRIGAVASLLLIAHTTFVQDRETFWGYLSMWPGDSDRYATAVLAWLTALGVALRLAYAQWWLRLEGKSLVAWPLIFCGLPVIFWYAAIAPSRYWYRGNFVSLEYFTEMPLVSNAWPIVYSEGREELLREGGWAIAIFALLLIGHAIVLVGDVTLARLASRALQRSTIAGVTPAEPTL